MSEDKNKGHCRKKVRQVPSRYLSAVEKIASQSSLSKEKSTSLKSGIAESSQSGGSGYLSQNSSGLKPGTSADNHASTPTAPGKLPTISFDASIIAGTDGCLAVPHLKQESSSAENVKRNITHNFGAKKELNESCMTVLAPQKGKKKGVSYNQKIAEAEVDLLYAEYLQVAFLESQAKKALQERCASNVKIMHNLFSLLLIYLNKLHNTEVQLNILSNLIQIHKHCQKQEAILKSLFSTLPDLREKYEHLASAIRSCKLNVKDVIVPESSCERDIIDIIKKMQHFLEQFFNFENFYNHTNSLSKDLKEYVDASEHIVEALKRGLEQIIRARYLSVSEGSLALSCDEKS